MTAAARKKVRNKLGILQVGGIAVIIGCALESQEPRQ